MTPLTGRATDIWVYLAAHPLFWLTATLVAYALADRISRFLRRPPWANPFVLATALLVALLAATSTNYQTFFDGAQFVHFLLGPATVALAVPLYRNLDHVRSALLPILLALFCGSCTAIVSAVLVAEACGVPRVIIASLAPKSVTAAIAMSIAETWGGIPTLTACLVLLTGIFGALFATPCMNLLRIKDDSARGFAAGLAAHGLGTARAFEVSPLAGTFAGIALALNGALTSILVPVLLPWLMPS
jgi:predicted murein hydrolase (TIGR00659 family)